jgi:hypothetical protein
MLRLGLLILICFNCLLHAAASSRRRTSQSAVVAFVHWPFQIASAAGAYVGLVAFLDRPRGSLVVAPESAVQVAESKVQGQGLFATAFLRKGTVLGTYPGAVIPLQQNLNKLYEHPCCEIYIWRFSDSKMLIDPTDAEGKLRDLTYGGNPSTFGSFWICQNLLPFLSKPTTLCRINEPPIGYDVNVCTKEDLGSRRVTFILERDVQMGEELFIDYGLNYDRSGYRALPRQS